MNETTFGHQFGVAFAVVSLIEWLKRSGWCPWLTVDSGKINLLVSLFVSFIAAIGITVQVSGNAATGWHFAGVIPPVATMLDAATHFFTQWGLQEFLYHNGVKPMMTGLTNGSTPKGA